MKLVKRVFIILLTTFALIVALTTTTVGYLLTREHLHIPQSWIAKAAAMIAPDSLRFAKIELDIYSQSLWRKRIQLNINDVCLKLSQPELQACIPLAEMTASVGLPEWTKPAYSLNRAKVTGLQIQADLSHSSTNASDAEPFDMRKLGAYLQLIWEHVDDLDIELAQAKIQTTTVYEGKAHLTKSPNEMHLQASESSTGADVQLSLLRARLQELNAKLNARLPSTHHKFAVLTASLTSTDWHKFTFETELENQDRKLPFAAKLAGSYEDAQLATTLSVNAKHLALQKDHLIANECPLQVHIEKREVHLRCAPSQLRYILPQALFQDLRTITQSIDLKLSNPPSNELTFALDWSASDPRQIVQAKIQTHGQYNLQSKALSLDGLQNEMFTSSLKIPQFEKLVAYLRATPFAVPAPANALRGPISIETYSERDGDLLRVPFKVLTRLTSAEQHLNTNTRGIATLAMHKPFLKSIEVDSSLQDILITLPKLSVTAAPQLKPDPRFRKEEPRAETPGFPFKVRLHTPHPRAIRIASNLTGEPLPIGLDMTVTDDLGLSGQVQMAHTPLNVMKRDAQLEYFTLNADPMTGRQLIDGKLLVTYANYKITILLMGTTDEPRLQFDSQPPLDQQQIIAVLVFGRPLEELGDDQRGSVASMNSAVTEAALGLGSMYLLAATPIEQMTYNPDTHRVAARVRLKDEWSLDLSSRNSELSSIGLQRRLGAHWTLNTYTEQFDLSAAKKMKIFLQWFKRY